MQPAMHTVRHDPLPQRRHRKMLKDGSAEVWPQQAEDVFLEGLKQYWSSPWANFSRGRSRWRNQFLVDHLAKNGITRSKKQVASHIQVLRNMWKGHPHFHLVAGPDDDGSSPPENSRSPTRRSLPDDDLRRRSISSSSFSGSPPTTPLTRSEEAPRGRPPRTVSPASSSSSSHMLPARHSFSPVKAEYPPQHSMLNPPPLPALPPVVRVSSITLWTDGMEPNRVDVEALPTTTPPSALVTGTSLVRTSLKIHLQYPADTSSPVPSPAHAGEYYPANGKGFSGRVAFTGPIPSNARCLTSVFIDLQLIFKESAAFTTIPSSENGGHCAEAYLPDSWLSRCRAYETDGKNVVATQQISMDGGDPTFIALFELERLSRLSVASPTSPYSHGLGQMHGGLGVRPSARLKSYTRVMEENRAVVLGAGTQGIGGLQSLPNSGALGFGIVGGMGAHGSDLGSDWSSGDLIAYGNSTGMASVSSHSQYSPAPLSPSSSAGSTSQFTQQQLAFPPTRVEMRGRSEARGPDMPGYGPMSSTAFTRPSHHHSSSTSSGSSSSLSGSITPTATAPGNSSSVPNSRDLVSSIQTNAGSARSPRSITTGAGTYGNTLPSGLAMPSPVPLSPAASVPPASPTSPLSPHSPASPNFFSSFGYGMGLPNGADMGIHSSSTLGSMATGLGDMGNMHSVHGGGAGSGHMSTNGISMNTGYGMAMGSNGMGDPYATSLLPLF